jgi:hypothetical protein
MNYHCYKSSMFLFFLIVLTVQLDGQIGDKSKFIANAYLPGGNSSNRILIATNGRTTMDSLPDFDRIEDVTWERGGSGAFMLAYRNEMGYVIKTDSSFAVIDTVLFLSEYFGSLSVSPKKKLVAISNNEHCYYFNPQTKEMKRIPIEIEWYPRFSVSEHSWSINEDCLLIMKEEPKGQIILWDILTNAADLLEFPRLSWATWDIRGEKILLISEEKLLEYDPRHKSTRELSDLHRATIFFAEHPRMFHLSPHGDKVIVSYEYADFPFLDYDYYLVDLSTGKRKSMPENFPFYRKISWK